MKNNFRTLQLAMNFYQKARSERFPSKHMKDQFDRALLSIPLNLSEGSAKPTKRDGLKFYSIAMGSLREVQTLLQLTEKHSLITDSDPLAEALYCLCRSLRTQLK